MDQSSLVQLGYKLTNLSEKWMDSFLWRGSIDVILNFHGVRDFLHVYGKIGLIEL